MSRASSAMSDAYSEASSHYSYMTEASSSSAGTFQARGRAESVSRSIGTRSASDGTSYFTVETTKTEKENRSWLEHFWAWILTEEKDPTKNVDKRQAQMVKQSQSLDSDDDSEGSGRSDASDLMENESQRFVALEGRNDEQESHHKNVVVVFNSGYGRDSADHGLQSDDKAVKRSRHRVRPPTPRYAGHRSPTPEHSPSPVPKTDAQSGPPTDTDSVKDDERSTNSKRSFRIGTGNGAFRSKHDLPPRPSSSSTFGKGRGPTLVRNARVAPPRVSINKIPPSDAHLDSRDSNAPVIKIKSTGNNKQVPEANSVDAARISSGVSVKEIIQKIETPPSTIKGKLPVAYRTPEPTSTTKEKVGDTQKNVAVRSDRLFAKNDRAKDTREIASGHTGNTLAPAASSRFRSLGARKRFETPVFVRSASFDGVLTDDSLPSSSSRDDSKKMTLKERKNRVESRTTNDDKETCVPESRCDNAGGRNLSSEALAASVHRDIEQNDSFEQDSSPTRTRVFGDKTMKTKGTSKEKHWSNFSGSAAVFLSLFQQKENETGGKNRASTLYQPVIPKHTMSMDRYDATSSPYNQDSDTSEETVTLGKAQIRPSPGTRFNVVNPGRKDAQGKIIWTQLKAHRSFS